MPWVDQNGMAQLHKLWDARMTPTVGKSSPLNSLVGVCCCAGERKKQSGGLNWSSQVKKVIPDMDPTMETIETQSLIRGQKKGVIKCPDHIRPQPNVTEEEELNREVMAGEALKRRNAWEPSVFYSLGTESFSFAGHVISIRESLDTYGALIWPGAVALCNYLEKNQEQFNLLDKAVLELGAGTGLVSIVASLMGAWVTATDLPDILDNLNFNLSRNTRGRCRYTPQVAQLTWGEELGQNFPSSIYNYDYILCADVVYHHDYLDQLLITMKHFCRPGTTLLWANKVRFQTDLQFTENFKKAFNTTLLAETAEDGVKIYQATALE